MWDARTARRARTGAPNRRGEDGQAAPERYGGVASAGCERAVMGGPWRHRHGKFTTDARSRGAGNRAMSCGGGRRRSVHDRGSQTMTDDEADIGALIERWAQAVHAGDLDGVLADHASDLVMFDVPPPYDGVRGIEAYLATWPPFFDWRRRGRVRDRLSRGHGGRRCRLRPCSSALWDQQRARAEPGQPSPTDHRSAQAGWPVVGDPRAPLVPVDVTGWSDRMPAPNDRSPGTVVPLQSGTHAGDADRVRTPATNSDWRGRPSFKKRSRRHVTA